MFTSGKGFETAVEFESHTLESSEPITEQISFSVFGISLGTEIPYIRPEIEISLLGEDDEF